MSIKLTLCIEIDEKIEKFYKREVPHCYIIWKTRNIRSLFQLKDEASHVSFVVYEGKYNCSENCISETGRNVTIRWDEHSDIGKNLEAAKHRSQFPEHRFNWKILRRVPNQVRQRKIHKVYCLMCMFLTLNNQLELTSLTLFRNGST